MVVDEGKAWAIADVFKAMRKQRKARRKAEYVVSSYWIDRATEADQEAIDAVNGLLKVFGL